MVEENNLEKGISAIIPTYKGDCRKPSIKIRIVTSNI